MEGKNILLGTRDHICTVTINRPPANAWNLEAMEEFELALREAEDDSDVRVVIITGAGDKCFSAGFDVRDAANAEKTGPKGQMLWKKVFRNR
jgi:enoyl-CoA hydratase/carnithine racemase